MGSHISFGLQAKNRCAGVFYAILLLLLEALIYSIVKEVPQDPGGEDGMGFLYFYPLAFLGGGFVVWFLDIIYKETRLNSTLEGEKKNVTDTLDEILPSAHQFYKKKNDQNLLKALEDKIQEVNKAL